MSSVIVFYKSLPLFSYFNDLLIVGQLYNKFLNILHYSIMYTCRNFRIFVILICSIQLISFKLVKTCLL